MEERNLDLNTPVTREQWEQLGRRAAALGREEWGFEWKEEAPERIRVYMRDEEARGLWGDYFSEEGNYGVFEREFARFVFNDGSPYAELEVPRTAEAPAILPQEEQAMQLGLERWVREKWQQLMRESGLHYDRGHVPYD